MNALVPPPGARLPPCITEAEAVLARVLALRRRLPDLAGLPVESGAGAAAIAAPWTVGLALDGEAGRLTMPRALRTQLLAALDPAADEALEEFLPLLLELAVEPLLAALSRGEPAIDLCTAAPVAGALPETLWLLVGGEPVRLDLPTRAASQLAAWLERFPPLRAILPGLPAILAVRVAASSVMLSEWRAARPGDVVLARAIPQGCALVASDRFLWHARREGGGLLVTGERQRPTGLAWEAHFMEDEEAPDNQAPGLDDLPIRLSFELGRIELPLAELETLGPGAVLELARDEAEGVDIVANGRRIGAGRPLLVGGRMAVQITRLGDRRRE